MGHWPKKETDMAFEITIRETKTVRKIRPKQWTLIGPEHSAEYGNTPEVETLITETDEIYSQVVEELDLLAVILAANQKSITANGKLTWDRYT